MGLDFIGALVLIAGGLLAASTIIVARRPDAQQVINRLVPFQAMIGVALLALGIINSIRLLTSGGLRGLSAVPFFSASLLSMLGCSILLGFLFGMPLISRLIPGSSSAEQKAAEFAQKIAAFQIVLGLLGIVASLLYIVFRVTGKLV
jgi:hypothetical protein